MTKLAELANANGFTVKSLSQEIGVRYTTLVSMAKTENYNSEVIGLLAKAIKSNENIVIESLKNGTSSPFIKWVGGKRQLLPELMKYRPNYFKEYYEPFIGGGAFFLHMAPNVAHINDLNEELVNTWKIVKKQPKELIELVEKHAEADSKEYYIDVRLTDRDGRITNMSDLERAARFIYLNKAGYNGLWRVNAKGQNNVPWGHHVRVSVPVDEIKNVSKYLNEHEINISNEDYQKIIKETGPDDFVYFDPPYVPVNPTSAFTSYTKEGFGEVQQKELHDIALKLAQKNVFVMLSNSDVSFVNDLYKEDVFKIHHVTAKRMINSNGSKRGKVGEVIITTY